MWINLGAADGLRRQTSFSVFDADDSNPLEAKQQGQDRGHPADRRHLAEARIVEDDLSNPMMPGDQIFSPTWEPGRPSTSPWPASWTSTATARATASAIRDLIALNGGVIDAEVDDDGKKTGEMSINTKYLVLGTEPDDRRQDQRPTAKSAAKPRPWACKTIAGQRVSRLHGLSSPRTARSAWARTPSPADFKPRLPEGVQRVMPASPSERAASRTTGRKPTTSAA